MAIEAQKAHSNVQRGHDARHGDRASGSANKGAAPTEKGAVGGFLGLLSSLQADEVQSLSSSDVLGGGLSNMAIQVPDSAADMATGTLPVQGQIAAMGVTNIPQTMAANPLPQAAGLPNGILGLARGSELLAGGSQVSRLAPDAGQDLLGAKRLLSDGVSAAGLPVAAAPLPEGRADADAALAGALVGGDGAKGNAKALHGKFQGLSVVSVSSSAGGVSTAATAHWSKGLQTDGAAVATVELGRVATENPRSVSLGVAVPRESGTVGSGEAGAAPWGAMAEPRAAGGPDAVKKHQDATMVTSSGEEAGATELASTQRVGDLAETASVEEDPAKYWMSSEARHAAELKVDDMGGNALEISIQLQGGDATVAFKTDAQHVQDALWAGGRELERMLGQQGMGLSGLSVGTSGTGAEGRNQPRGEESRAPVAAALGGTSGASVPPPSMGGRRPVGVVDHFV